MSWLMSFVWAYKSCEDCESSVNYKMYNSCPLWDSNQGPFAYEANALLLNYEDWSLASGLKFAGFYKSVLFLNLFVVRGRCSEIICRELHFVISLQSADFLVGQTAKRYKYYMTKNTRQIILLHLPCAADTFLKIAQLKPGELLSTRHT